MHKKPKEFVQLSQLPKTEGWLTKEGKIVPFESLTTLQLQDALYHAESKQQFHHNRSSFFAALAEKAEEELENRGVPPEHFETEFTKKNVEARQKTKQEEHGKES